jgi:hypothetical protein
MGYELWASPVTGYRRRGTRLDDFRAGLGAKITVHEIFEPLLSCPAQAPASEMKDELTRRDFDAAGVKCDAGGPVTGFVRRETLTTGLVEDHIEPISSDLLTNPSVGIAELLDRLSHCPYLFVTIDEAVSGVITVADLNKPLVRVYFFGLLSLLEIHMSFWVAQEYPNESWKQTLKAGRVEQAAKMHQERERRGQRLSLADCLQFADKRDLVVAHDGLRDRLSLQSKKAATKWLSDAEGLRNTLAHSQYDLVQGSSWPDLIALVQWVQAVIARSDASVDARVAETAKGFIGTLW